MRAYIGRWKEGERDGEGLTALVRAAAAAALSENMASQQRANPSPISTLRSSLPVNGLSNGARDTDVIPLRHHD